MRSWLAIDSSNRNSTSGTRRSCSRAPIWRRKKPVARCSARDVSARHLEVRGNLHARQRDEPDTRVVHFAAGEHFAEDVADLLPDAIWSITLSHDDPPTPSPPLPAPS
jgi:hypothetical protein